MSGFVLTPAAEGDLLKIIEYLEGDNPNAVLKVVDALDEAMQQLADNPGIGHLRPDLTDQDVRFWSVFKYLVIYRQVQLLTAQRPGEVRSMRSSDLDLDNGWWSMPASVAKNARPHRVPLTKAVVEILERRRELAGDSAIFVFENRPGASSIAHRGKKAASILCRGLSFEFRAHDLRRTATTRMAEAGVPRDHIAKVLNHVEGGPAATRVYDRYAYDAEKRDALDRWARRLLAIIEGKDQEGRSDSGLIHAACLV
jgi:integrase